MNTYKKKYKEALERARKLVADLPNGRNDRLYHVWDLESIFPELKESEDERIKNEIINFIKDNTLTYTNRGSEIQMRWIAWLEKQGEQKSIIIDVDKMVDDFEHTEVKGYGMPVMIEVDAYRKGVNDALRLSLNLEKQSGQRPTDEEMKTILQTEYEKGRADAIAEVQKSAWSEEDEKMLKWLCRIVHSQRLDKVITLKEESELGKWMDKWLNHNPQPQQEWSEEDDINFKRLLYFLDGGNLMQYHKIKLFIWVESLKERYTWKPSDNELEVLRLAAEKDGACLMGLYEQLKKLKG